VLETRARQVLRPAGMLSWPTAGPLVKVCGRSPHGAAVRRTGVSRPDGRRGPSGDRADESGLGVVESGFDDTDGGKAEPQCLGAVDRSAGEERVAGRCGPGERREVGCAGGRDQNAPAREAASMAWNGGPHWRVSLPSLVSSTLTTSAPGPARTFVARGPDRMRDRFRTRIPARTPSGTGAAAERGASVGAIPARRLSRAGVVPVRAGLIPGPEIGWTTGPLH
jgi:hypothetical protein